jgi:pyruvate ferredoxin oxidoreductase gamma subunit
MYRIRIHGRGGQGMVTASRMLGTAFFLEGYEVQDAPRYGAERRGAPIFAYIRAAQHPIKERGVIHRADLVIVADDSLIPVPAAGVLASTSPDTTLLINTSESAEEWRRRLSYKGSLITLPALQEVEDRASLKYVGAHCAGAAARLLGVISRESLNQAVEMELDGFEQSVIKENLQHALTSWDYVSPYSNSVRESSDVLASDYENPDWVDLPLDAAPISTPAIHARATSLQVRTGLWRTMRPVIDYDRCSKCWWVCSTFCPDGAIDVDEQGLPKINYDTCKGCMICVGQCPPHAIEAIPETEASKLEEPEADS